ncbi:undecaprenyl/decaprenyl-phosphate alpha-N-acetylglucosaminyl 1-phosphate transferase, partial [Candidatus Curtissbacteria bacterium]|nr:undecaprenyl/decaprenyl-phosphate alpha-N-acetylglucosaminyl 1-phosphate transferase [Candidatus Curtissbacteria bacterium]
ITTLLLVPLSIAFANKYGFLDNPKKHKHPAVLHNKITPRAGGLPIFLAVVFSSLFFIPITQKILGVFFGGFLLVITGLIDDKFDIGSRYKLMAQVIAALIVVAAGVGISFIPNPFSAVLGQGYEV